MNHQTILDGWVSRRRNLTFIPASKPHPSTPLGFDAIYDKWFHGVRRWARAMGVPAMELDDVTQEVFVVAHRKLAEIDPSQLGPWLYRVTRNTASSHRRQAWFRRMVPMKTNEDFRHLPGADCSALDDIDGRERHATLQSILERLKPDQREVFMLFEIEGLSGEEIANLQGICLKTAWSRLRLARNAFMRMARRAQNLQEAGGLT